MDGEPILGPVPRIPGLFVACTLHSGGFSYNTVIGRLLAQYVMQGNTDLDVSAFLPERFDDREEDVEEYLDTMLPISNMVTRRH